MKILFIVPGSGDAFYCGNCFRDTLHAGALRKTGHEVIVMPLYLPFTDEAFKADTQLFFPAISFYVARKFFKRQQMPKWLKRILNSKYLLKLASSMSGSTTAKGMEDMTLSMIYGNDAVFDSEANRIIEWIATCERPDIVHLSSALLTGIARKIKQHIDIPVVCTLQDEEVWIDSLKKNCVRKAWEGIAENLCYIDRFVTSSNFYKAFALEKFPQIKNIEVIYPGIDLEKYASDSFPASPTIGFFYRMNKLNGLDILAKAFVELKKRGTVKDLKLKVGGGYTGNDKKFLKQVKKILSPYMSDVEISDSYNLGSHAKFYSEITLLAVPLTFDEGAGLYLCEAFASGRPAVEPVTGSFPEILEYAGLLYLNNNSHELADVIEETLTDNDLFQQLCQNATMLAQRRYNASVSAQKLVNLYKSMI
ncbi:MAG: glycosyltransferase family 4 protein [Prevotellaceae bacterium]|jgi:glycosyltransferase involved in cell wall biosynthesis|nr:glycosyltransferase family 4 protein [Prevotellaceae bacterium]